jgi:photosystem II stability/assembly factor-like uncharacterized protein
MFNKNLFSIVLIITLILSTEQGISEKLNSSKMMELFDVRTQLPVINGTPDTVIRSISIENVFVYDSLNVMSYYDYDVLHGIFKSTDGCKTFSFIYKDYDIEGELSSKYSSAIASPTKDIIIWSFDNNKILRTMDGGSIWDTLETNLNEIAFLDMFFEETGVGVANVYNIKTDEYYLLRSTNFGEYWDSIPIEGKPEYNVFLTFNNHIFSFIGYDSPELGVIKDFKLYYSVNSGVNWEYILLPDLNEANENNVKPTRYFIYDLSNIWVLYSKDTLVNEAIVSVYYTSDLGNTWEKRSEFMHQGLYYPVGMKFYNTSYGIINGTWGNFAITNDGGKTWEIPDSLLIKNTIGLKVYSSFINPKDIYITTYDGKFFLFNAEGFSSAVVDNKLGNEKFEVYPNPAKDNLTISFKEYFSKPVNLQIFNILGKLVRDVSLNLSENSILNQTIDISELTNGVYYCVLEQYDKKYVQIIIKE